MNKYITSWIKLETYLKKKQKEKFSFKVQQQQKIHANENKLKKFTT